jgi:hypothetical protein
LEDETMIPLANVRDATAGSCGICGLAATMWRRGTGHDGLVLAVRACDAHEDQAVDARNAITVAEYAASIPAGRRAARAAAARRKADRLRGVAAGQSRRSASLRGASSATHTLALLGGWNEQQAGTLDRLATALETAGTD